MLGLGLLPLVAAAACLTPSGARGAVTADSLGWRLVGVSVDRKALVITTGNYDFCHQEATGPELVESNAHQVVLKLNGTNYPDAAYCSEDSLTPSARLRPYVVSLPSPLAGQAIIGDKRNALRFGVLDWNTLRKAPVDNFSPGTRMRAPSTIGLRVADAIEIARSLQLPRSHIKIRGPRDGYVTKQSPSRLAWLEPETTRLTFTTRSRYSEPASTSPSSRRLAMPSLP